MERKEWLAEAVKRFPDLPINGVNSPYELWFALHQEFERAYESDLSRRVAEIYDYAKWCCEQPPGNTAEDDLGTCVSVTFFEHIPENQKALKDMPNWFTMREVESMRKTFSYHVGEEGYARILSQYRQQIS